MAHFKMGRKFHLHPAEAQRLHLGFLERMAIAGWLYWFEIATSWSGGGWMNTTVKTKMGVWLNGMAIRVEGVFLGGVVVLRRVGVFIGESKSVLGTIQSPDDELGGGGLRGVFFSSFLLKQGKTYQNDPRILEISDWSSINHSLNSRILQRLTISPTASPIFSVFLG